MPELRIIFARIKSIQGARKEEITVYTMIGFDIGRTILVNIFCSEAPSSFAASLNEMGIVSKNPFAISYPSPAPPE